MLKIFLWFVSTNINFLEGAINTLARQNNGLDIVGAASFEEIIQVDDKNFDVLLVVGARNLGMSKITQVARQLNLPEEKILGDWIVTVPGFTLENYRRLQRSRLSIFSMNCFGGLISHTMGLPFRSPFVNLWLTDKNFIKFLHEPRAYMEKNLVFKEKCWQTNLNFYYPLVKLSDVEIHMNHYRNFDEAVKIWERRKARINWYNLFVTMYTEDEKFLEQFDELPYAKKVCFVPFKSDLDSAWYINRQIKSDLEFWDVIAHFGFGEPFYYDPFDMLLYGKKTPLIEM